MGRKVIYMPAGMAMRKFYCPQCGQKLQRRARTRTVTRDDPDYWEHSTSRTGTKITWHPGDVEVTEYDLHCPDCDKITLYQDQLVTEYIQKKTGSRILSQSEIREWTERAETAVQRRKKLSQLLFWGFVIAVIVIARLVFQ